MGRGVEGGPGLGWKLRHSLWMIPALVGLGVIAWVSFTYIAARARRVGWGALAVLFLVAGAVAAFWPDDPNNTQGGLLVFAWAAGIVAALIVNPSWLRWRWEHRNAGYPTGPGTPSAHGGHGPAAGPQDHVPPGRGGGPTGPVFGQDGQWRFPSS